jgi:CHAD domain-containing protein
MPLDVPARSFAVPSGVDADALVALLDERLDVTIDSPVSLVATVFDTADRRVRDAGAELRLEPGSGGARLVLHERPGAPQLSADVSRARRYLVEDLPGSPLRDRLAGALEMRALLPLVRLAVETRAVQVRNKDEKTVVRLAIVTTTAVELPAPATGSTPIALLTNPPPGDGRAGEPDDGEPGRPGGPVALVIRVELAGVLGYPKPLARVEALLAGELGLSETTEGPADEAVAALGGDPAGVRSKVRVALRPDQRTDAAAVEVLADLAGMVEVNVPGTLDDLDSEFLHDLRVAVRRSRSVLREMRRAFPARPLGEQRDALKWIQAITGPTRDLDVQLLDWDDLAGRVAADRRPALAPVHELVVRHRTAAFRKLRRQLTGEEYERVWRDYRAFLAGVPALAGAGSVGAPPRDAKAPIARSAGRRIRRVHGKMLDMGGAIDDASPADSLHDLRKRGKELRYLLELFGGLWPAETVKPMVKTLKGLQDVLGLHQDREVQADALRALAPELTGVPGGADALLSLGVLVERLEREQHEARRSFTDRFAAFAAPEQRAIVDRTFRAGP